MSNNQMQLTLFEKATRERYRFPFNGSINVEDLWTLSLQELDQVAIILYNEMKNREVSFIQDKSSKATLLETKLEVVKRIIEVKKAEVGMRKAKAEIETRKQELTELIQKKKLEAEMEAPLEELEKKLKELMS